MQTTSELRTFKRIVAEWQWKPKFGTLPHDQRQRS